METGEAAMYRLVETHPVAKTQNSTIAPLATLEDGYGGVYHIAMDDGCYVLYGERDGVSRLATHWFPEAVEALKGLTHYKAA